MSNPKNTFLCSLPWSHISVQSSGRIRACCHDEVATDDDAGAPRLQELKNPDWRHKLSYYAKMQKTMLDGGVPKQCGSCYRLEKAGLVSPRKEYNEKFSCRGALEYLDITLDNNCNLKCRMCSPKYSQSIGADWEKMNIPMSEEDRLTLSSPSVGEWLVSSSAEDFWQESLPELKLVTITGGEPFLSPYLAEVLKKLEDGQDKIELRFYTNTTIFPKRFVEQLEKFMKVTIYCSFDGVGETSDYIRYPSKWESVERVFSEYLAWAEKRDHIDIQVHTVVQAYNIGDITQLFEYLRTANPEGVFIPSLTAIESPKLFALEVLPIEELEKAKASIDEFVLSHKKELEERHQATHKQQLDNLYKMIEKAISTNISDKKYIEFIALTKRFDDLRGQKFKKFG